MITNKAGPLAGSFPCSKNINSLIQPSRACFARSFHQESRLDFYKLLICCTESKKPRTHWLHLLNDSEQIPFISRSETPEAWGLLLTFPALHQRSRSGSFWLPVLTSECPAQIWPNRQDCGRRAVFPVRPDLRAPVQVEGRIARKVLRNEIQAGDFVDLVALPSDSRLRQLPVQQVEGAQVAAQSGRFLQEGECQPEVMAKERIASPSL